MSAGKQQDLFTAIRKRDVVAARDALDGGASPNTEDTTGRSSMVYGVEGRSVDIVRLLIERGGDVNCKDAGQNYLLHIASARGDLDMVELLVGNGALTDVINQYYQTPEKVASDRDYPAVADFIGRLSNARKRKSEDQRDRG